jgi:hypothetical protein
MNARIVAIADKMKVALVRISASVNRMKCAMARKVIDKSSWADFSLPKG